MIAACVLAAGGSRRFGATKQLEQVGDESWVRRTARLAREAGCAPVLVVTGADADRVSAALDGLPGVETVHHPGWRGGMGSSIAAGVRALGRREPCSGVLLLTCDQLALDREILERLLEAFDGTPRGVAASAYAGTVGIPVVFGRGWLPRLAELDGDRGAKGLLLEDPGLRTDVDWPAGAEDRDRRRGAEG
jgi:CTP:molybdopterin cytidylyltransferase MocA